MRLAGGADIPAYSFRRFFGIIRIEKQSKLLKYKLIIWEN